MDEILDIVHIIQALRKVEALEKILLSKFQASIIPIMRGNVLVIDDDGKDKNAD